MIVLAIYLTGFIITMFWWGFDHIKIKKEDITFEKIIKNSIVFLAFWLFAPIFEVIEIIRLNYGSRMYNFFTKPLFKVTK